MDAFRVGTYRTHAGVVAQLPAAGGSGFVAACDRTKRIVLAAIVHQAVEDATSTRRGYQQDNDRLDARRWMRTRDFDAACRRLGYDPAAMRAACGVAA